MVLYLFSIAQAQFQTVYSSTFPSDISNIVISCLMICCSSSINFRFGPIIVVFLLIGVKFGVWEYDVLVGC